MSKHKRKASPLQILAAQNNGAKSHGPATPEGRAASARNAARHNICSKTLVLTSEDEAKFAEHQKTYFDELQPVGEIEFALVTDLVVARWRQWRLWALETALLDLQMDKQAKMIEERFQNVDATTVCAVAFQALADESKALSLLMRYETSMRRMYEKSLKTLMDLQAIRKAAVPEPEESSTPQQELRNEPGAPPTSVETITSEITQPPCEPTRRHEAA